MLQKINATNCRLRETEQQCSLRTTNEYKIKGKQFVQQQISYNKNIVSTIFYWAHKFGFILGTNGETNKK